MWNILRKNPIRAEEMARTRASIHNTTTSGCSILNAKETIAEELIGKSKSTARKRFEKTSQPGERRPCHRDSFPQNWT